jgi:hypothetical protein
VRLGGDPRGCGVGVGEALGNADAKRGDGLRELARASRRFAEPERNRRRQPLGVVNAHAARLPRAECARIVAEQDDVAGQALDGEVLR